MSVTAVSCRDALPACTDPSGCITIRANDSIQIAYMLSLSGNTAVLGESALRGIETAVAQRENKLLDHAIELVGFDSGCNQQLGERAANLIEANDALIGLIGPSCSDVARLVISILHESGVVVISPSATAPNLIDDSSDAITQRNNSFFRTVPNNLVQAQVAATFAYDVLEKRTAVTIHDGTAYARSLQQQFSQTFQRLGGSVIFQGSVTVGDAAVEDVLSQLIAEDPDIFYMPVFPPEANLITLRLLDLNDNEDLVLMGADSLLNPTFPVSAESAVEAMYLTGTAVRGPAYDAFLVEWASRYETIPDDYFHVYAYDATNILLAALSSVAIQSGNGSLLVGRQALREAVAKTTDFPGVSGSLTCQLTGDCAAITSIGIYEISNDEISGKQWPPAVVWTPN